MAATTPNLIHQLKCLIEQKEMGKAIQFLDGNGEQLE